jgi:hypothetical protein
MAVIFGVHDRRKKALRMATAFSMVHRLVGSATIDRFSTRGEQLTRLSVSHYLRELL